ncbi:PQQ-binding-like beta-propeller repeat protein [bacterium]|nr:PQQ-binding-like beta-propeller repeat protein [bacterium]MBU1651540.1 PQQ-binding-like beta-propeller repeat protein [bacterium]MBU1882026.1 PQQ-binding-like beta-propeller repeat protein [bacterium]
MNGIRFKCFLLLCLITFSTGGAFGQGWNISLEGEIFNNFDFLGGIEVQCDYAYVTTGKSGLQILDVSNPDSITIHGFENAIWNASYLDVSGEVAFVTSGNLGTEIWTVDISDPMNPEVAGYFDADWIPYQISYSENCIYVASSDSEAELQVFDANEPENLFIVGSCNLPDPIASMCAAGSMVYACAGLSGLRIIDASTPQNPVEAGFWISPTHAIDCLIDGDLAYVVCGYSGLRILNISNPEVPFEINTFDPAEPPFAITSDNDYLYLLCDNGLLTILDATDPLNLTVVDTLYISDHIDKFTAVSDQLYGINGIEMYISVQSTEDPQNIYEAGRFSPRAGIFSGISVSGEVAAVSEFWYGLHLIDVNQPSSPMLLSSSAIANYACNLDQNSYLFIANQDGGIIITDCDNPFDPEVIGWFDTPGSAQAVTHNGSLLYIADGFEGVCVADVSDPSSPTELGSVYTSDFANDLVYADNFLYVADGYGGLRVIDVSDPQAPYLRGVTLIGAGENTSLTLDGDVVYIAGNTGSLYAIDVSNPDSPVVLSEYTNGIIMTNCQEIISYSSFIYVALENHGLRCLNVEDPANVYEVGYFETPGCTEGVAAYGNYAVVADAFQVLILNCSEALAVDPFNPDFLPKDVILYSVFPNPFNATTLITFTLPSPQRVDLSVYNLLGQKVVTLVDGYRMPGAQTVHWDASGVASGVYWVRIIVSGEAPPTYGAKKVVVVK